jgi:hypothetical protein
MGDDPAALYGHDKERAVTSGSIEPPLRLDVE